jgi:hypothetical protein
MGYEFVRGVGKYLSTRRQPAPSLREGSTAAASALVSAAGECRAFMPSTVRELADFNVAHQHEELALFGQVGG